MFLGKTSAVQDRQIKVQRLVIPFKVTHNATSTSVVLASDEAGILFMRSAGIDQITGHDATAAGEFSDTTLGDAAGKLDMLLDVGEKASKVCYAAIINRGSGALIDCYPDTGGTQGVSTTGSLMLYTTGAGNLTTTDLDACLVVEYVVSDGN